MRKKIVLLILTFALCGINIAFPQIKVITESDNTLKKNYEDCIKKGIKSISTYRYDVDEGVLSAEMEKVSVVTVDAEKRTYTEINLTPTYSKTVSTLNEQNNVIDVSIYYSDNSLMSKVVTEYESGDRVKDKIYYLGNAFTFKADNIYSSGNIVEQDFVDSLGKTHSYSKLYYDNSARLIEEDKFNENDSLDISYKYVYDESGNCTEEITDYPQAKYLSKVIYKYDKNGNVIEKTAYGLGNKLLSKSEFKYNEDGLFSKEIGYSIDNKVTLESEFKYDGDGNKTEWRYADYIEDLEYLYKYDYVY